jgi:hypothetical protein
MMMMMTIRAAQKAVFNYILHRSGSQACQLPLTQRCWTY